MLQMDGGRTHFKRLLAQGMSDALADTPVICLLGSRQCGKSTLAEHLEPDRNYLSLDDPTLLRNANADPMGFVQRLPERVTIDEVQRVPELLLAIKREVDMNRRPGRFLLTGSANLLQLPKLADSLAGRMESLFLHPLAEAEKENAEGQFLARLLADELDEPITSPPRGSATELSMRLIRGGYPEPLGRSLPRARQWHRQYLRAIIDRDVRDVAQVKTPADLGRLLKLLSLRTASLLNVASLGNSLACDRDTVLRHLAILETLFLIRQLPAWHKNSSKRLIKTPKVHLCDSGLTAALSGLQESDWLRKRDQFGHLLESFVVQQLIAQADWTDPELQFSHYRDKDQVEVDCVIEQGDDLWGIEIKMAATATPADGKGLRRLAGQAGKSFRRGILLYDGTITIPLGDPRFLAVPISKLWTL